MLLINGAPGSGKSTLARRYADDHPLTLTVDVDGLRMQLGDWQHYDESKLAARELALALTRSHVVAGHDVVVPQFLARPEFREQLRALADDVGTAFVEVVVTAAEDTLVARFRDRRDTYRAEGVEHPEADLRDDDVASELPLADARLVADARTRDVPVIATNADVDACYRELVKVIRSRLGRDGTVGTGRS